VFCRVLFVICCLAALTHHLPTVYGGVFAVQPAAVSVFTLLHRPSGGVLFFPPVVYPALHIPAFPAYASDIAPLQ